MVSTDSAVVHDDIPCPKSYSIPLLRSDTGALFVHDRFEITFLTSNLFLPSATSVLDPALLLLAGASLISTSAMIDSFCKIVGL